MLPFAAHSAPPETVVTIKPLHALVSGVMGEAKPPRLIVTGSASPHAYNFKPSDARALENADVVFWMGEDLERFMKRPLATLARKAKVVKMVDTPGMKQLKFRQQGPFAGHDHAEKDHAHQAHDEHSHGAIDMHLWLDPRNAKAMVAYIVKTLSGADPENAAKYRANAEALSDRLDALDREIDTLLAPVKGRPFIVFHDSYQYFETRYGVVASGSITVSPDVPPGARRVREISQRIRKAQAICVFAEPQFNPKRIKTLVEGTHARTSILDPIGAGLEPGPELYFTLLRALARSIHDCLSKHD